MMFRWRRPITLVDARVVTAHGLAASIRFDTRVLAIDEPPRAGDAVVGLDGAVVLPGLLNAHDHLELNHYGPLKCRARYGNASDWIDDLRPVIRHDRTIRRASAHPLHARVFVGALKNLLSGVTTVAHHNPLYRELRGLPINVVRRFGWAHSFGMEEEPVGAKGEPGGNVGRRLRDTPPDTPFIMHLGEGTDERAAGELPRLQRDGGLRPNSLLVHGVAWTVADWQQVVRGGAGLVWCPASNQFLFGTTARVREFLDSGRDSWQHVCLGSDSRLTGARDLLDELRLAGQHGVTAEELLRMVTATASGLLRTSDRGTIAIGLPADLIVLPNRGTSPAHALLQCARADLRLVVVGGTPMLGDRALGRVFAARGRIGAPLVVDGIERVADAGLTRAIAQCPISEAGVVCLRAA